jgi:energy coupling factor transporter S component ThiW
MSEQRTRLDVRTMSLNKASTVRRIALSAVLASIAIVLSPFTSFPLGFATPNPTMHMVNAISGVLLGPWYAVLIAVLAALGRNILRTGTVFAFPGSIFGGLVAGLVYRYVMKKDYAALSEPIGTGFIGATISAYLVGPWALQAGLIAGLGTVTAYMISFFASSIPGSILGFIVIKIIRRTGVWRE